MSKMFFITEIFRLWTSHIVLGFFGIKLKAQKGDFLYSLLYNFRQNYNAGKNNKIIVIENGVEKAININKKIKGLYVSFQGNNNKLIVDKTCRFVKSNFIFNCSNSIIKIDAKVNGNWQIHVNGNNSHAFIGKNSSSTNTLIFLVDNSIEIGKDCMFSNNIRIITDAHSVLDNVTKKLLNFPKNTIKIGNHVWVGERVTITKNAQIADDCIVGIASVVTKDFIEKNVVLAGCPAKIVKRNITWDRSRPSNYNKNLN